MGDLKYNFLLLICIGIITGCSGHKGRKQSNIINNPTKGKWQDQAKPPLKFTHTLTIGNQTDLILSGAYQIDGPVVDSTGNIYFIDTQRDVMYCFNPQGNLRWKTGQKGKGPGDFNKPFGLVINGHHLYTANIRGTRIDEFNLQGKLINSTPTKAFDMGIFSSVVGFISDSLLVTSNGLMGTFGAKITILNTSDTLEKTAQFKVTPDPDLKFNKHLGMGVSIGIIGSLIAAGNSGDYTMRFYDKNGNVIRTVSRNFDKLVRFGHYQTTSGSSGIGSFGALSAPVDLYNGYYLVHLSWPTNVTNPNQFLKNSMVNQHNSKKAIYKNALDLYDTDWTLLYSLNYDGRAPKIGTISYVDSKGNIYTKSNSPFPQIRRYKVIIRPPKGK
jgi:outer membrane protein assembly factor BamB